MPGEQIGYNPGIQNRCLSRPQPSAHLSASSWWSRLCADGLMHFISLTPSSFTLIFAQLSTVTSFSFSDWSGCCPALFLYLCPALLSSTASLITDILEAIYYTWRITENREHNIYHLFVHPLFFSCFSAKSVSSLRTGTWVSSHCFSTASRTAPGT